MRRMKTAKKISRQAQVFFNNRSRQAFGSDTTMPSAPRNMAALFNWHNRNATVLMEKADLRASFIDLLSGVDKIVLHEDYAGIGTAGATLTQQFNALKEAVAGDIPERPLTTTRNNFLVN